MISVFSQKAGEHQKKGLKKKDFVVFFCNSQRQRGSINQATNAKTFRGPFLNLWRATSGPRAAGWTLLVYDDFELGGFEHAANLWTTIGRNSQDHWKLLSGFLQARNTRCNEKCADYPIFSV